MTARDDLDRGTPEFDRLMSAWFDAESHVREPDDLLERTIALTARARPRPGWALPERWLPMELTMRQVRLPRATPYLALAALLVLAIVVALVVGAQRRVPPPFGLAANGVVAVVTPDGDVATVDPSTGEATVIVGGPEQDRYPVFSLDGTRIAFVRAVTGGDEVFVVDARGGGLTSLTRGPVATAGLLTWSPDGSKLAFSSLDRLWIAETDGTDAHQVDLDLTLDAEIEWRPRDGTELIVRGVRDGLAGLFLVPLDGSPPRAITPIDGGYYDYLWLTWSPDGRRLAYSSNDARSTHLLTIGGSDIVIEPDSGQDLGFPRFSPDGSRLAMMVWQPDNSVQVGVVPADDPTPHVTLAGPTFHKGIQFDWSPDGTSILAAEWTTDEPWVLDPNGGEGRRTTWSAAFPDWVEWQRLAD